ncbi:uncharacterized protein LOC108816986 isoform X2 [Raphanus sativus]|uniref:Uncharacterized protein LOC108816986 isoform X2 n=1 Tax=Raphanus sativus TaxID=3726 RepID=A0A6J0KBX1_RAPSA|nr:uncharacterized protein LOC108816986 isoform X2 [Raphanus sativus]XP_018445064.1 uncharacterized protein LOC108816986 isoform X2 [Raphanus sativus]
MRPHYNRPQRPQQQNNGYPNQQQQNGYHQNPGMMMMNPQMMMMMMGHMNNMPMHPHQPIHQFAFPNHPINQLHPNHLGSLHSIQPTYYPPPYTPVPPPPQNQNHQSRPPGFSEARPQVQSVGNVNNTNNFNPRGSDSRNSFTKQQNFRGPGQGSQSYQGDNAKKKFGFNKAHKGKGKNNKMAPRIYGSDAGIAEDTKRPYIPNYPPKEVQQWRQARRKNFPTKLNVEKKIKKNDSNSGLDDEAKLRRQQLREVLAKQRELGVEVAEVPSHYLSNPVEQVNGDNSGQFQNKDGRKGRFRHNKRRYGGKDKFDKRRKFQDKDSSEESSTITTREPTLLEKLLSADIKKDKIQLLQVLRFMEMNSFFKESPEGPLKFPLVMVEETGCEHAEEVLSDDDDVDESGDDDSCDEASD